MASTADIIERLTREASEIQAYRDTEPSTDNPVLLAERIAKTEVYLSRSGEMLAQAKMILNQMTASISDAKGEKWVKTMGPQLAGKVLAGYCAKEQFLVDWLDRINRGLVHSSDSLRSLLSYAKAQMVVSGYADNVRNEVFSEADTEEWE